MIRELPSYKEEEENEFANYEDVLKKEDIYHNNKVLENINLDLLTTSLKRKYLFDCLRQAFNAYKHKWAYSTILNLLKSLYKERDRLSPKDYSQIENMIDIMNNKVISNISLDTSRTIRDEKIKSNPLQAGYIVTDSRVERIVSGDSWESKQLGLNSKMYINN